MTWNLQTARDWLELVDPNDTSYDTAILAAQDIALGLAEDYCGRGLIEKQRIEYLSSSDSNARFNLGTMPIKSIDKVVKADGTEVTEYTVRKGVGMLILKTPVKADEEIEVTYTAGPSVLPTTVEHALWGIFNVIFNEDDDPTDDDITSINLPDVGTISYNPQNRPAVMKATIGYYLALLDPYKANHGF